MKVIVTNSYDETCAVIAEMIRDLVNQKPNAKLGLATGGTPVPIYKKLIEMNKAGQVDFSQVHTVNLDEYCGIPGTHEQSYRYFMDTNLFNHINIDKMCIRDSFWSIKSTLCRCSTLTWMQCASAPCRETRTFRYSPCPPKPARAWMPGINGWTTKSAHGKIFNPQGGRDNGCAKKHSESLSLIHI